MSLKDSLGIVGASCDKKGSLWLKIAHRSSLKIVGSHGGLTIFRAKLNLANFFELNGLKKAFELNGLKKAHQGSSAHWDSKALIFAKNELRKIFGVQIRGLERSHRGSLCLKLF